MYQVGKTFLESEGFRQVTPYDFERTGPLPSTYLYEQLFRKPFQDNDGQPIGYDAWGWGFAGISFFFGTPDSPGAAYMNHVHVDQYFRDIDANRFPILRGYEYSAIDLRLHLLFQELQGLSVDRRRYASLFGCDVVDEHDQIWTTLHELEWASIDDNFVTIEGNGVFYLPLIQNMLAHDRSEAMRKHRIAGSQQSPPSTSASSRGLPDDVASAVATARAS
jgi:coproporphyrinogen III oxidase-like Fe-S oxidoreductase